MSDCQSMKDGLIDRLYESAFVPELWPSVLGEMADIATARAGFLFVSKGEIHRWASSTEVGAEAIKPFVESGWVARSDRFNRMMAIRDIGFQTEAALYPTGGLDADPFYRDILYPRGLGHGAGLSVALPTGDCLTIGLEREYVRGPVEAGAIRALDLLRPHIARSATLAAHLQLEKARATSQALASIGLAALVFDQDGRVIAANALIEAMTGHVVWRALDRLSLKDRKAELLLRAAIASVNHSDAAGVRSFPVRDDEGRAAMIAHVVPIRLSARDIFARCAGVLVLTSVAPTQGPPADLVKLLFDLTPTEARVARELAEGRAVEEVALGGGVSTNTIRSHVGASWKRRAVTA
jgi:DNA-binding CsgD family transcriptional regulator